MLVMKRLYIILAIIAFVACNQEELPINGNTDITIDTSKGYIHFDTATTSRGELVTSQYLQGDFAVYGYYYASTWAASYMMAKPNVFDQWPETVHDNGGVYSYEDPVLWKGYNYSFYAYYPAKAGTITEVITKDTEGEPYITYKIPSSTDPKDYIDFMTASYIDTNANASKTVRLQFHHRLSAIDVGARCFYDYTYEENGVTKSIPAIIEVAQLRLTFQNLMNDSADIYLNKDKGATYTQASSANQKRQIDLLIVDGNNYGTHGEATNNVSIAPNKDGDTSIRLLTKGENTMIVLPQTELLKVTPSMIYYIRIPNDETIPESMRNKYLNGTKDGLQDMPQQFDYTNSFEFDRPLLEGRRYYIQFNFTSDAVSVNIVAADEWNEDINGNGEKDDNIDYEFE